MTEAMTEAEWFATDDTAAMFGYSDSLRPYFLKGVRDLPRRVASLFGVGCVRATPTTGDQPFLPRVVVAVEQAAETGDWSAVDSLFKQAEKRARRSRRDPANHNWDLVALRLTDATISPYAFHIPLFLLLALGGSEAFPELRRTYACLLRDAAGNPFRGGRGRRFKNPTKAHNCPVLRTGHITSTVRDIARGMYESRDFSPMPILADALQDAGCEDTTILDHCRGPGPHVRGCWVVDLVLGK